MDGDSEETVAPGQFIPTEWNGHRVDAWVPTLLSERFLGVSRVVLKESTIRQTEQALQLARQASEYLPSSWISIARLLTRSEGIASSLFEGISSPVTEVALAISHLGGTSSAVAVAGNVEALAHALSHHTQIFTLEMLHGWHRTLMAHATYLPIDMIGSFRTQQGWIGGSSPRDAALVTAPPNDLARLMIDLEAFINDTSLDPITQAAIAHAQFETIHPYGDGNGRVGRVSIAWILAKRLNLRFSPPLSVWLSRDRGGYLSGLVMFQQGNDDAWIRWFADIAIRAATWSIDITSSIASLVATWDERLVHLRKDAAARRILTLLPERFVVTTRDVVEVAGVSERSARTALAELHRLGIIQQIDVTTGQTGRPRTVWIAPELASLVNQRNN